MRVSGGEYMEKVGWPRREEVNLRKVCFGLAMLAAGSCASAPKKDQDQGQIRYQLAVGYYRDRRVEAAVEELEKALKADPENADAYNMLGIVALGQGNDY